MGFKKLTYNVVKNYVENYEYLLIDYNANNYNIVIEDKLGYKYDHNFMDFRQGKRPVMVGKINSYSIMNIKIYLLNNNINLDLLTTSILNVKDKLVLKDIEGYYYTVTFAQILKGYNSYKFSPSNNFVIQNINLWCKINNPYLVLLSDKYINARTNLKWKCLKDGCGETFEAKWDHIQSNHGCPYCAGVKVCLSNCLATKRPELAKEWHTVKNGDLTPYDITYGSGQKVWWECNECGYEWRISPSARYKHGCPKCNESKGEKFISSIFDLYNINYISQKTFPDCIYKYVLRFDFYLPDFNVCIEYNGRQHYEPVEYFGGEKQFQLQQQLDQIKRDYCKNNNINLIEIPYWDFDNIEMILKDNIFIYDKAI